MVVASAFDYLETVYPSHPQPAVSLGGGQHDVQHHRAAAVWLHSVRHVHAAHARHPLPHRLCAPPIRRLPGVQHVRLPMLCTSLFSFAAMLPKPYLIAAISRQSFTGILSALVRIVNKASSAPTTATR